MEKYAQYIIDILLSRDIPCLYNREEMLVYSGSESLYGSTHGVYGCCNEIVRNTTIYDQWLSVPVRKDIRTYLEKLNREISGGYFLTNLNIEYIVFSSEYVSSDTGLQARSLDFTAFCLRPHELFTRYRRTFYQMINPG